MPAPEPPPDVTIASGCTFVNVGTCSTCGARIVWCLTSKGNRAPFNPDGVSHFATCPQAGEHRHRRTK